VTTLAEHRAHFVKKAIEVEGGVVLAAIRHARRRYSDYVRRDISTGEDQDICQLAEKYAKDIESATRKAKAEAYRNRKG